MTRPSIYLAGPMSHLYATEAHGWRAKVAEHLRPIHCLSPMRGCDFGQQRIVPSGYDAPLMTDRAALVRNRFDIERCDLMLVNLFCATRISAGTVMEIGMAHMLRKPVVAVMEPGNPHEHAMILEAIDYRVSDFTDALDIVRSLLDVATDPPARAEETVTDPTHGGKVYRALQPERYAELAADKGGL